MITAHTNIPTEVMTMTDLNRNFANKIVLITGGTSGIGLETARQFVAQGVRVLSTCLRGNTHVSSRHGLLR